jgi:ADP-glucose pyrophosphorylase
MIFLIHAFLVFVPVGKYFGSVQTIPLVKQNILLDVKSDYKALLQLSGIVNMEKEIVVDEHSCFKEQITLQLESLLRKTTNEIHTIEYDDKNQCVKLNIKNKFLGDLQILLAPSPP